MKDYKLYKFFRPLITFYMNFFYKIKIVNKEYLLENDSIILCGNHTNYLDPLLIASATKRNIMFITKDSLHKGIKKYLFKSLGTIPVDRNNKNSEALKNAIKALNNKKIICIFPEGTINKSKDIIMPFKFGAVSLAFKTNSYIIPFAITGKYKLFKKSIKIEFLKPYKIEENLEKENNILMKKVKKLIIENGGVK